MKASLHLLIVTIPIYVVTLPLSILSFQLSSVRKLPDC